MVQVVDAKEFSGKRLDKAVLKICPSLSRSTVYALLRKGRVKVNGKKKKQNYLLKESDHISLFGNMQQEKAPVSQERQKMFSVLYEDDDLLVVSKSPFLASQPGTGVEKKNLIALVKLYMKEKGWTKKVALAHRLDRGTSGCVIVAKHRDAILRLYDLFKEGKVRKIYLALVIGKLEKKEGILTGYLQRVKEHFQHKVLISDKKGEGVRVQLKYKVQKQYEKYALVEVELMTGKLHQIRAQCAYLGHPVVGDRLYGNKEVNKEWREKAGLRRQFLHAWKVSFVHPFSKERMNIEDPLPDDLKKVLSRLK